MENKLTFDSAYSELEEISKAIENESISIDLLEPKLIRAAELIKFCQTKLRKTDNKVKEILTQMESDNSQEDVF